MSEGNNSCIAESKLAVLTFAYCSKVLSLFLKKSLNNDVRSDTMRSVIALR